MSPARQRWALAGIVAAGAALRFATLGEQSFWFDEAATVRLVERDFGGMLDGVAAGESTPPLYYVLAWAWGKLLGTGEAGLRSLSALAGTAAVAVAYLAGSELRGRAAGLGVAALAAASPLLVWYSQEARAYSLLVLLAALSLWLFARALRRPTLSDLALWALASVLALATHYFAAFLVAAEAALLLGSGASRRPALAPVGAVALAAAALLPLALHQESLDRASFIGSESLAERLIELPKQFLVGFDSPFEVALALAAGVIAAAGLLRALWLVSRAPAGGLGAALAVGGGAIVLPLLLSLAGVDYLHTRNVIAAWLPFAVVTTAGLLSSRRGAWALAALCALGTGAVVGVALDPRSQRDDWRGIAEAIGPSGRARAIVVQPVSGRLPLSLYRRDAYRPDGADAPELPVRELVAVAPVDREAGGARPAAPPRPRGGSLSLPGFHLVERRTGDSFTLLRYRSQTSLPASTPGFRRAALHGGRSTALLYEP